MKRSPCPICKGKVYTGVFVQNREEPCQMCGGHGFVFPDVVCICGRPAMTETANTLTCGRQGCVDKILGLVAQGEREESEEEKYVRLFTTMY